MFRITDSQARFLAVAFYTGLVTLAATIIAAVGGVIFLIYRGIASLI